MPRKAAEEGYIGAAALFRAQARAEKIHAQRFAAALKERGVPVPPDRHEPPTAVLSPCAAAARNPERMKQGMTYDLCLRRGYTSDIGLATCPDCGHHVPLERMN